MKQRNDEESIENVSERIDNDYLPVANENSPLLSSQSSFASYTESENHFGESRRSRKPFHYNKKKIIKIDSECCDVVTGNGNVSRAVDSSATPDEESLAIYNRLRYYNRLCSPTDVTFRIPDHVVPPKFFYGIPNPIPTQVQGNQSSIVTIFVIWNTMVGTSLLSIPWAISQAGFVCGLSVMLFMAALCFYTAYRILCVQKYAGLSNDNSDFSHICSIFLGRYGSLASVVFSLCTLLGATIVCWILSTNFLYHTVFYIHDVIVEQSFFSFENVFSDLSVVCHNPPSGNWTPSLVNSVSSFQSPDLFSKLWDLRLSVPIIMVFVLGPLISVRSPAFLAKFSALGTLSVLFLIGFITTKALTWGFHVNFVDQNSIDYVPYFKGTFFVLSGTLALSLFIHNCILSIVQNQKNPENNARDLFIAYLLVTLTYLFIGGVFYAAFPLNKDCIADNFLDNISGRDVLAFLARIFLFFQILTVCPLLVYIFRIQFMYHMFGSIYPGYKHVMLLNATIVTISVMFAIFMPSIGTIIRFSGAFCGLAYVFMLPCLTYLAALKEQSQLGTLSFIVHVVIMLLGVINFIAQFVYV